VDPLEPSNLPTPLFKNIQVYKTMYGQYESPTKNSKNQSGAKSLGYVLNSRAALQGEPF